MNHITSTAYGLSDPSTSDDYRAKAYRAVRLIPRPGSKIPFTMHPQQEPVRRATLQLPPAPPPPARATILTELDELHHEIDDLKSQVVHLIERLAPVLVQHTDQVNPSPKESPKPMSGVRAHILGATAELQTINNRLSNLTEMLDL